MKATQIFNIILPHSTSFIQSFLKHIFLNKTDSMKHCYFTNLYLLS